VPWVLFRGESVVVTANGDDERTARAMRESVSGDYLWFRLGGNAYVTQDAETLARFAGFAQTQRSAETVQDAARKMNEEIAQKQRAQLERLSVTQADVQAELEKVRKAIAEASARAMESEKQALQLGAVQEKMAVLRNSLNVNEEAMRAVEQELRARAEASLAQRRTVEAGRALALEMLRSLVEAGKAKSSR